MTVTIGGKTSKTREIDIGVPQSSVLGPLFFLQFINDLPDDISCGRTVLVADDTSVVVEADSSGELQDRLNVVSQKQIDCKSKQTVLINFFISKPILDDIGTYAFDNNHTLQFSNTTKFLGIFVDSDLT